jgi:hypothetical protein
VVGEVPESVLASLYGRCSAFLAPAAKGGSGLALVEAMKCGAPVVGADSSSRLEIIGDAGLLVESPDPSELASALEDLLSDVNLANDLRRRALDRAARFSFDVVVDAVVETLGRPASPGYRFDLGHGARPRIAAFLDVDPDSSSHFDLASRWLDSYAVDLYLEPGQSTMVDGFPTEVGGFDARLFDRIDAILGYHAVVYCLGGPSDLDASLGRIARRPGLVILGDDAWLDLLGASSTGRGPDHAPTGLRELFQTGSRVAVRSPRLMERIGGCVPEFADQLVEIPPFEASVPTPDPIRARTRLRLDFPPESIVIGLFGRWESSIAPARISRAFDAVARAIPGAIFLSIDSDSPSAGDRFLQSGPFSPEEAGRLIPALDLAINLGGSESATLPGLLRAGVPTISFENDPPGSADPDRTAPDLDELCRRVVELASDPEARSALLRSACADCFGIPDPPRASKLLLEQVEVCSVELRRGPRQRRRLAEVSRGLIYSPHFPRAASATGEAASRSR